MKRCAPVFLAVLLSLYTSHLGCASQHLEDDVLEMKVKGVTMDPEGNTPIVVLEDPQGHRAFPIWIGLPEARAILLEMEGLPTPRPLTHALLKNILTDLQVEVTRIVINDMRSNTFFASILLRQGPKTLTIDARPSDAIALALHAHAPIFVAKKVLGEVRTVTLVEPTASQPSAKTFGMHVQGLDTTLAGVFQLASPDGVLVSFVEAGSQAERHGIRRGDVITGVDGAPVKDLGDFLARCKDKKVGQEMVLQVTREQNPVVIRFLLSALE
jgi:bifunctional DNase/RNase